MLKDHLERLLAEGPDQARQRSESEFDRIARGMRNIVLFGAGGLGKKMQQGLRQNGLEPVAFSDNNPALWGSMIDGTPVLPPPEAAERYGKNAVFVVTIWRAGGGHRLENTASRLRSLGCKTVVPFMPLLWKYPDCFLPYYCIDSPEVFFSHADRILAAFDLWSDELSRREYVAQVRFRLMGEISCLASPVPGEQYFPTDVLRPLPNETFIDCGAYDGDTIRTLLRLSPEFSGQIIAFEPDPDSFRSLAQYIGSLPEGLQQRIRANPFGTGKRNETLRFNPGGGPSSAIDSNGSISVHIVSLDEYLKDDSPPTFIKMDIEGAELDALAGAANLITHHMPALGISSYHAPDHLWQVSLQIASLAGGYDFFLRPHNEEGWDLVTYALTPERGRLRIRNRA